MTTKLFKFPKVIKVSEQNWNNINKLRIDYSKNNNQIISALLKLIENPQIKKEFLFYVEDIVKDSKENKK